MCTTTFKNIVGVEVKDFDLKEHGVILEFITEHGERCKINLDYDTLKFIRVAECPTNKLEGMNEILENRIKERRYFYGEF